MKNFILLALFLTTLTSIVAAQNPANMGMQKEAIKALIDDYARARETSDTLLLKNILMPDVDQLVSSGEWRRGIEGSMQGMMRSSSSNPGDRTLSVEQIRFVSPETAIVDARYEIRSEDRSIRKMWSTFLVVSEMGSWKISAIRNMLPAG